MNPRTLFALAFLLAACRSNPPVRELDAAPSSHPYPYVVRAAVDEVPDDARSVVLWVLLPEDAADRSIENLRAAVFVGNAALELPAASLELDAEGSCAGCRWTTRDLGSEPGRSLRIETDGKPIDVELRFDVARFRPDGSPEEAPAAGDPIPMDPYPRAEVDGAAWPRVSRSCARVK